MDWLAEEFKKDEDVDLKKGSPWLCNA
ncbi:MAG: hypothetical protein U5L96_10515 [Owenweeksia sp.]|nr:hypothetical protein [Owenweeksia sp.]